MKSISYYTMHELYWTQPDAEKMNWTLMAGETVLAMLQYADPKERKVVYTTADGTLHFKRQSEPKYALFAHTADAETPVAEYIQNWSGAKGTLTLHGTKTYKFAQVNVWGTRYELRDGTSDTVLLSLRNGVPNSKFKDSFKTQLTMEVASNMLTGTDLALCCGLTFYILLISGDVLGDADDASSLLLLTSIL